MQNKIMTANIRRLTQNDIASMQAMNQLFATAFEDPKTYSSALPDATYLKTQLGNPMVVALAAFYGDMIVGGLVGYILPKLEQARTEIYIYDLATAESHRRRGIATALITEVQAIAAASDAWVVFVQADHDDPPAIALYNKLGVQEDVLHFDILPK